MSRVVGCLPPPNWCGDCAALKNPEIVARRGGLKTILKNVIDCQLSRINEALMTTILHLLNHPHTRQYVRSDVELEVRIFVSRMLKNGFISVEMYFKWSWRYKPDFLKFIFCINVLL